MRVAQEHRLDLVDAFDGAAVQRVWGCRDLLPVAVLPLGYAAEEPEPRRGVQLAIWCTIMSSGRPGRDESVQDERAVPR